ncbi:hypothetical protein ABH931_004636 [Streptacidiphilus sp. MAP12-33]|uniref:zinc-binding dehydrogenase n=1 Tax=Streptacidiphilus sp. MAP12-33 TaxID=3156266 RepID=UPI003513C8EE
MPAETDREEPIRAGPARDERWVGVVQVRHHGIGAVVVTALAGIASALALHGAGTLRLPLYRVLPLTGGAEAQRISERGHLRGKIVLTV